MACSICTDRLASQVTMRTSCGHAFHRTCLAQWQREGGDCPLCRAPLPEIPDLTLDELRAIPKSRLKKAELILLLSLVEAEAAGLKEKAVFFREKNRGRNKRRRLNKKAKEASE